MMPSSATVRRNSPSSIAGPTPDATDSGSPTPSQGASSRRRRRDEAADMDTFIQYEARSHGVQASLRERGTIMINNQLMTMMDGRLVTLPRPTLTRAAAIAPSGASAPETGAAARRAPSPLEARARSLLPPPQPPRLMDSLRDIQRLAAAFLPQSVAETLTRDLSSQLDQIRADMQRDLERTIGASAPAAESAGSTGSAQPPADPEGPGRQPG